MPTLGFRTESYSGSGVRNLADIIEYEMSELHNKDIPQYVLEQYECLLPETLRLDLEAILGEDGNEQYPFLGDGNGHGVDDRRDLRNLIARMISAVGGDTHLNYGLWLADRKEVLEHYAAGLEAHIDAYTISPFVFSDIGPDGCLFGYALEPHAVPEPIRFELVCWPEDAYLIEEPAALTVCNCEINYAKLIPQDYIEHEPKDAEVFFREAYYRIAEPFASTVERRFRESGTGPVDLLHVVDSRDVFVSAGFLNRLISEDRAYEVRISLGENFLHPCVVENQVEVFRRNEGPECWTHFFESGGKRGYASNYGFDTTIREITDGTTDACFSEYPEEHEYRRIYEACKTLGLPCGNITFNF